MSATFFFFNDTATTEIYTLSLHDALPISSCDVARGKAQEHLRRRGRRPGHLRVPGRHDQEPARLRARSEEHTSELQSRQYLVCRLLLEKKTIHKIHAGLPDDFITTNAVNH